MMAIEGNMGQLEAIEDIKEKVKKCSKGLQKRLNKGEQGEYRET